MIRVGADRTVLSLLASSAEHLPDQISIQQSQDVHGRSKTTSFSPATAWKGLSFGSPCSPSANMGNQKKEKGQRCRRRNLWGDERLRTS